MAATLSGINTGRVKMIVYSLSGLCSIAAIIIAYRLRASNPDSGMGYQLESIAAVIVSTMLWVEKEMCMGHLLVLLLWLQW